MKSTLLVLALSGCTLSAGAIDEPMADHEVVTEGALCEAVGSVAMDRDNAVLRCVDDVRNGRPRWNIRSH